MGLRDPEKINEVLGAKIWWRGSMYYSEPWAQIWHMIYAPTWDKQNLIRFLEDSRGSHIWQSANQNHSIIQSFIFWEIHDGESIKFFSNSWNQQSPIAELTRTPILKMFMNSRVFSSHVKSAFILVQIKLDGASLKWALSTSKKLPCFFLLIILG